MCTLLQRLWNNNDFIDSNSVWTRVKLCIASQKTLNYLTTGKYDVYLFVGWSLSQISDKGAAELWPCANVLNVLYLTNGLELQMNRGFINVLIPAQLRQNDCDPSSPFITCCQASEMVWSKFKSLFLFFIKLTLIKCGILSVCTI